MRGMLDLVARRWRAMALLTVGVLAGGTVWAVAAVPSSSGTITVCYPIDTSTNAPALPAATAGNLIVIDPSTQTCSDIKAGGGETETELTFNQTGVVGPAGVAGSTGATGPRGPAASLRPTPIGTAALKLAHQGSGSGSTSIDAPVVSFTLPTGKGDPVILGLKYSGGSLLSAAADKTVFRSVLITLKDGGSGTLVKYTLTSAVASKIVVAGASGVTTQTLTLKFSKIVIAS